MASNRTNDNFIKLAQIQRILLDEDFHRLYEIEKILNSGYDINYSIPPRDDESTIKKSPWLGYTALHFAAKIKNNSNFLSLIDLLYRFGADFSAKNSENFTPLRLAFQELCDEERYFKCSDFTIQKYYTQVARYFDKINSLFSIFLTSNTANLTCNNSISHLHIACVANNLNAAELLIKNGASVNNKININSKILPGHTPLSIALRNGSKEMVNLLLNYGARFRISLDVYSDKRITYDFLAVINLHCMYISNQKLLELIFKASKDDFDPVEDIGLTELHVLCIKNQYQDLQQYLNNNTDDVNAIVNNDSPIWPLWTPLHFAAHCSVEMVILLLSKGANLMAVDANDNTPLDICVSIYTPLEIANILNSKREMKTIRFNNGAILTEIISQFRSKEHLLEYLKIFRGYNPIIPLESPLWPGYTLLHIAILLSKESDSTQVELCLDHGTDFTIQDANQMTALHLAFRLKKFECIKAIFKAHVDNPLNPVDDEGISHFHLACVHVIYKVVENFLKNGIDPNAPLSNYLKNFLKEHVNYLHKYKSIGPTVLSNCNSPNLAKLLLEHGADPNIPDENGFSWTHRLFLSEYMFSDFNLKKWAIPKIFEHNIVSPGGLSNLHIACYIGYLDVVKKLSQDIDDFNQPINEDITKFTKRLPYYVNIGDTLLHFAAEGNGDTVIPFLLSKGADVHAKNIIGETALHNALSADIQENVLKLLSDKYFENMTVDEYGLTPLHVASSLQDLNMIEEALKKNDVTSKIRSDSPLWPNWTPLHVFAKNSTEEKNFDVLKVLYDNIFEKIEESNDKELHELEKRQKLNLTPEQIEFYTYAFHKSCKGNDPEIVRKFLDSGLIDINARSKKSIPSNNFGYTALHYAVEYGSDEIIEMLLKRGADVTIEDSNCKTACHLAAQILDSSPFKIFLRECKYYIDIRQTFYQSPFYVFLHVISSTNYYIELLNMGLMENLHPYSKLNLLGMLARNFVGDDFKSIMNNVSDLNVLSPCKHNIIHYIVMSSNLSIESVKLAENLEYLDQKGCDIDNKDTSDQTPLQFAAYLRHFDHIDILLSIGADVNQVDIYGRTVCDYLNYRQFPRVVEHLNKLLQAGLFIHQTIRNSFMMFILNNQQPQYDFESMNNYNVTPAFTLRSIFTEEIFIKFPMIPFNQREIIIEYVNSNDLNQHFPRWVSIYKVQIRKCIKRKKLWESMKLTFFINFNLPDLCVEMILMKLTNEDWSNIQRAYDLS